jgi:hypothetical protein
MHHAHNLTFYEAVVQIIPVLFLTLLIQREFDRGEPPGRSAFLAAFYNFAPLIGLASFVTGEALGLRVLFRGYATDGDVYRVASPLYIAIFFLLTPLLIPYCFALYEPFRREHTRVHKVVGLIVATMPYLVVMGTPLGIALHAYL